MEYEKLLAKARTLMPQSVLEKDRFEIPKAIGHLQGNKTIISNFHQIADVLRRPTDHFVKYVLKELAAPGQLTHNALIIGTKIPASRINQKIRQYANELVLCSECGKPDTKLEKEGSVTYLKCTACGARHSVHSRI
ncbi:MAG: translation initiation factor IF-2 subunit beta [Candidatus Woesearchaeota archaeon]